MRRAITCGALAALTQLSGCFAVFVPGSVIGKISDGITGDKGEHCVPEYAKVGERIKLLDGRIFTVVSLSGKSARCTQDGMPIRAELALLPDKDKIMAEAAQPLPPPVTVAEPTEAERAAACRAMDAVKPGAPQAEFELAWAGLNRLGMTWRDCRPKKSS